MAQLDKITDNIYSLLKTQLAINKDSKYNMEVLNSWYQLSLQSKHKDVFDDVDDFVSKTGRMKFIRPSYLYYGKLDRTRALSVFNKNK